MSSQLSEDTVDAQTSPRAGLPVNPHVIVVGNEKGGAGKSTIAVHLTVALILSGHKVAALDLDVRQRTFSRYMENRARWMAENESALPMPFLTHISPSSARNLDAIARDEEAAWQEALAAAAAARCAFIVVDAPGSDTGLSRLAHGDADTIITPINDSFVDFDLLGVWDTQKQRIMRPSLYSEMVWDSRKRKMAKTRRSIDWVVMRNRMSTLNARNKQEVHAGLKNLSQRVGFRLAPGFAERVIYRELFPLGLTLLDLTETGSGIRFSLSHVAARQELRDLLIVLKLPELEGLTLPF